MRYARAFLIAILVSAFGIGMIQADWETRRVNDPYDDLMITTTGGIFQLSPWVQVKSGGTDLFNYYAFRSISIPNGSIINNAYLEFTAPFPWNFNQSLPVTIYGLKEGDLDSWNPAPPLNSYPVTTAFTNWDTFNLISGNSINVTITEIIQELYDQFWWYDGNDMGIKISSLAVSGGERYQVAYDSDITKAVKLYIEYEQGSPDEYYKGWTITPIVSASNNTILTWYDATDVRMRITTAQGTDYETHGIDPKANFTNSIMVDGSSAVGTDIYQLVSAPANPWNISLYKTIDRGATWTKEADIEATPQALASSTALAMQYDQNNSLHITWAKGFDTWYREFKIHNQSLTTPVMVFDGGNNVGQHRMFWDTDLETIWITRFGGDPLGSARHAWIGRRPDSDKTWETYKYATTDYRDNDVINVGGTMYWAIHQYGAGGASQWLRLFELTNYSDITSWNLLGIADPAGYLVRFDLGRWNGDPAMSIETTISGDEFVKQYTWSGVAMVHEGTYNVTSHKPASQPEFHAPKMYFNANGLLRMAIVVEQDSGYSIIDKSWGAYFIGQAPPPSTVQKATGHWVYQLGGDMRPFSAGQTGGWNVTKGGDTLNNTCIQNAQTVEEVQACIDDYLNDTDPYDPDPPATNYPEHEQFGRMSIKYYIWIIGQVCIIAPCVAMAYRRFPFQYYYMFVIVIMVGFGLLWSLSGM